MAVQERNVLVLYGSETGNAQDMAEEVGRVCVRLHFKTLVEELDSIDLVCRMLQLDLPCHTSIHHELLTALFGYRMLSCNLCL